MLKSLKTSKDTLLVWKPSEKNPPKCHQLSSKRQLTHFLHFRDLLLIYKIYIFYLITISRCFLMGTIIVCMHIPFEIRNNT